MHIYWIRLDLSAWNNAIMIGFYYLSVTRVSWAFSDASRAARDILELSAESSVTTSGWSRACPAAELIPFDDGYWWSRYTFRIVLLFSYSSCGARVFTQSLCLCRNLRTYFAFSAAHLSMFKYSLATKSSPTVFLSANFKSRDVVTTRL